MLWRLRILRRAEKSLAKLPTKDQRLILEVLDEMRSDPFTGDIARLRGQRSTWRRRVGSYRLFFDVDPLLFVIDVVAIVRRTSTTYR